MPDVVLYDRHPAAAWTTGLPGGWSQSGRNDVDVEVGKRIRTLRKERGLTQEALALRSGVTRNVLISVEHGRHGVLYERLFDLADALGVDAGELLIGVDRPSEPGR